MSWCPMPDWPFFRTASGMRGPFSQATAIGNVWSLTSLFQSGEEGVLYLPSDTTCFQSVDDTVQPCSEGDPVGFMLDLSQGVEFSGGVFTGLDTNVVTPGSWEDFQLGTVTEDGTGISVNSGPGSDGAYYTLPSEIPAGAFLRLSGELVSSTGGTAQLYIRASTDGSGGTTAFLTDLAVGAFDILVQTNTVSNSIRTNNVTAGVVDVYDNLSIEVIPGNHAHQTGVSAKPTLQQTAEGLWYLEHDYIDDRMEFDGSWMLNTPLTTSVAFATPTEPDGNNQGIVFGSAGGGNSVGTNMHIGRSNATQIRGGTYGVTPIYALDWDADPLSMSLTISETTGRTLRYNGADVATNATTDLLSTSSTEYIGTYRSFYSRLHFFGGMIIDRELSGEEMVRTEQLLAEKGGIEL